MNLGRFFRNSIKIIAVSGGSGSGKTTLANKLIHSFHPERAALIGQDSYYYDQSRKVVKEGEGVNFDHPSALEFSYLASHLKDLKEKRPIEIPIYDYVTHSRTDTIERLDPHPIIVLDGTLILSQKEIRKHLDYSIFLDVPEEVRFERRLKRDVNERGRTEEGVRHQFFNQVKPMHDTFVQPSKAAADLVVPMNYEEDLVLESITKRLKLPKDLVNITAQV